MGEWQEGHSGNRGWVVAQEGTEKGEQPSLVKVGDVGGGLG